MMDVYLAALSAISLWLASYWRGKYVELRREVDAAQERFVRAQRKTWPPIA